MTDRDYRMMRASRHIARIASYRIERCVQPQEDPEWTNSKGRIAALDGLIVSLVAEDGTVGEGHVEAMGFYADTLEGSEAAAHEIGMALVGQNPFNIEASLDVMNRTMHEHDATKAGFDCALHDLVAKLLEVPLHVLFGGRRHGALPLQRILPIKVPDAMAGDAGKLVARGYRSLKLKIDADGDMAVRRVEAVRRQVGPQVRLSVDANQAYGPKDFLPVMLALEKCGVDLIEQPVKASDWDGLKFLTDRSQVVIEGDECARSLNDIVELLAMKACDGFNLKVMRLGGLRNVQTAARLCEAAGRRYRVGTAFGPRLVAAQSAHLAVSLPRLSYPVEFAEFEHFLNDPHEGLETDGGMLEVADEIGSGVRRRSPVGG